MVFNESLLFEERRMEVRYSLNGLIPMSLWAEDQSEIACVFIDASSNGLGIIVEPRLRVDESVTVRLDHGQAIAFSIRWVKKPVGLTADLVPKFHRAGLCLAEQAGQSLVSIIKILEQFGCVDH